MRTAFQGTSVNAKGIRHPNRHLQAAWNMYGEDSFSFEVLEYLPLEYLCEREAYFINAYSSLDRANGYNNEEPDINGRRVLSEESRVLMSRNRTGKNSGTAHPCYGKPRTQETKAKISKSRTGRTAGADHWLYGKTMSPEHRAKIAASKLGKPRMRRN